MPEIQQRSSQWRCHAGADNDCGEGAHDGNPEPIATGLHTASRLRARLDEARHLQREEPEHRQREYHEDQAKTNDDCRLLKNCLQVSTKKTRGDSDQRVSTCHRENIDKG